MMEFLFVSIATTLVFSIGYILGARLWEEIPNRKRYELYRIDKIHIRRRFHGATLCNARSTNSEDWTLKEYRKDPTHPGLCWQCRSNLKEWALEE